MRQKLSALNIMGMGFMVFAMFLGAGNLIFPPLVGQQAGQNVWFAAIGFLLTGVGLPLLGIIAISRVGGGFNEISRELPKSLIVALGSSIYLIIGPLYAVPRTALVSYEVGIMPFFPEAGQMSQFFYTLIFFLLAWDLSIRPGKLLETVGKLITPALITLLIILSVGPMLSPLGDPGTPLNAYIEKPFIKGFLDGYMTMDALAAMMFGVVIITNLKSHGIKEKSSLFYYSVTTGIIAAIGLALIYISLFYLGATSRSLIPDPDNGAQILTIYTQQLLGTKGTALLAAVVALACLTTAIGCITATSEYFDEMFDKVSYRTVVSIITFICILFSNIGLNEIIDLYSPVLWVLYPTSIVLIILGLISDFIPNRVLTYRATMSTSFIFSLIDVLRAQNYDALKPVLQHFSVIPGYDMHMVWIIPSLSVFVITIVIGFVTQSNR